VSLGQCVSLCADVSRITLNVISCDFRDIVLRGVQVVEVVL
jgi:hypothetical protein